MFVNLTYPLLLIDLQLSVAMCIPLANKIWKASVYFATFNSPNQDDYRTYIRMEPLVSLDHVPEYLYTNRAPYWAILYMEYAG